MDCDFKTTEKYQLQIKRLQEDKATLKKQVGSSEKLNDSLHNEHDQLKKQRDYFQNELQKLQLEFHRSVSDSRLDIDALKETNTNLQNSKEQVIREKWLLQQNNKELRQELEYCRSEKNIITGEKERLEKSVAHLKAKMSVFSDISERLKDIENMQIRAREQIAELMCSMDAMKRDMKSNNEELEALLRYLKGHLNHCAKSKLDSHMYTSKQHLQEGNSLTRVKLDNQLCSTVQPMPETSADNPSSNHAFNQHTGEPELDAGQARTQARPGQDAGQEKPDSEEVFRMSNGATEFTAMNEQGLDRTKDDSEDGFSQEETTCERTTSMPLQGNNEKLDCAPESVNSEVKAPESVNSELKADDTNRSRFKEINCLVIYLFISNVLLFMDKHRIKASCTQDIPVQKADKSVSTAEEVHRGSWHGAFCTKSLIRIIVISIIAVGIIGIIVWLLIWVITRQAVLDSTFLAFVHIENPTY